MQTEVQERIGRMESAVTKSTRLCEADVSNVTDRIRQLEDTVRQAENLAAAGAKETGESMAYSCNPYGEPLLQLYANKLVGRRPGPGRGRGLGEDCQ